MPEQYDILADPLLEGVPVVEGYKVLGGVALCRKLGQGGMGAVYKGRHLRLGIDVAIKVLVMPPGLRRPEAARFVKRMIREARAAAAVKHANLIRVLDVNTECGMQYLVMDVVDGESAEYRLVRKGPLAEWEAVAISCGAAEGLAAAHRRGIVHRDVKPENILVEHGGNVVVVDLGLAKAFGPDREDSALAMDVSVSWQAIGTPFYMSPEQTRSARDIGPPTDVWSLGVTLYQLTTGDLPFSDTDLTDLINKIRLHPAPDVGHANPRLSDGIRAIMAKALSKDPADRHADCGELAAVLRRHLATLPPDISLAAPDAAETDESGPEPPSERQLGRIVAALAAGDKGQAAMGSAPPAVAAPPAQAGPSRPGGRTATDLVERRLRVEEARAELGEARLEGATELLRIVDRDMRVAREVEDRDPARALELLEGLEAALAALHERRRALEGVDWALLQRYHPEIHDEAQRQIGKADDSLRTGRCAAAKSGYVRIGRTMDEARSLAETRRQGLRFSVGVAVAAAAVGAVLGGLMPVVSHFGPAARWAVPVGSATGALGGVILAAVLLLAERGSSRLRPLVAAGVILAGAALGAMTGLAAATVGSVMHGLLGEPNPGIAVVRAGVALGAALGVVFALVAPNRAGRSMIAKVTVGVVVGGLFMALLAGWVPVAARQDPGLQTGAGHVLGGLFGFLGGAILGVTAGGLNSAAEKGAVARHALRRRATTDSGDDW
ncbi:MAG: protein kinase domain-containing protein [Planctomycetota bacterium]